MRSVLLVGLWLAVGPARAEGPDRSFVKDEAGLFGKDTVAQANREIARVRKEFDIDLVIETTAQMPSESEAVKHAWIKWPERNRQLHHWAQARAEKLGINGIYVVIFNGPTSAQRDVRVVGWPTTWEDEDQLSRVKREQLRKHLARELVDNPDRALLRTIHLFREQLVKIRKPDPSPLGTWPALTLVGCLVGAWVVLWVVRSRLARRVAEGPVEPLYQPATLGALFGVPAAFWVHDQLFRVIPPESTVHVPELPLEPAVESHSDEENSDGAPL